MNIKSSIAADVQKMNKPDSYLLPSACKLRERQGSILDHVGKTAYYV